MKTNKRGRHNLSLEFILGELDHRSFYAQLLFNEIPRADILCFNLENPNSAKLIVKTYKPGDKSCTVGVRSVKFYGNDYFWVLAGIPLPDTEGKPEYYIIPNQVMAENTRKYIRIYMETPGRNGQKHKDPATHVVLLPPSTSPLYWDLEEYFGKWEIITEAFTGRE